MAKVLVVDDYQVTRRVLSLQLRKEGHAVVTAENGIDALARLEDSYFELAIVDIAMPEMDGLTLLKHLRADDRFCEMPVIMLTASGEDQHQLVAKSQGANAFLTKPASSPELIATINRLLDGG